MPDTHPDAHIRPVSASLLYYPLQTVLTLDEPVVSKKV